MPSHQLYNFDLAQEAFKTIILAAVSSQAAPVQVSKLRQNVTTATPRVELSLKTQQIQQHRKILNPNQPSQFQPMTVWFFILEATVTTNRQENGDQHSEIFAKARMALQFYQLAPLWTTTLEPYHTIIDIQEQPIDLSIDSDGDLDMSKMTFAGQICIREGAWLL